MPINDLPRLRALADHTAATLDGVRECHADTVAQHRGEVAAFGDSWPGACADIDAGATAIRELEEELCSINKQIDRLAGPQPVPIATPSARYEPF